MLKFIVSVCEPCRLFPRILVVESNRPALAPPKGTVFVKAVKAPPLFEISKSAEGMLSPAPSDKAEAELAKNAYTLTLPMLGFSVQVVVAVIEVLPGLFGLPAVILKLTAFDESVTASDSLRSAFNVIALAAELSTCAATGAESTAPVSARTDVMRPSFASRLIANKFPAPASEKRQGRRASLNALLAVRS